MDLKREEKDIAMVKESWGACPCCKVAVPPPLTYCGECVDRGCTKPT